MYEKMNNDYFHGRIRQSVGGGGGGGAGSCKVF